MRRIGGFVKVAASTLGLLVAVGLAGVQPAGALDTLSCGAVVTTSIVLANDIGPCNDDGIKVGADNVTIDLNGHQVFGTGGANVPHQAAGVYSDNHTGVVVKNGTIHDFYHGVRIRRGSGNRVTGLTVRDNIGGNGIVLETSSDNLVDRNVVVHNGRFSGIATFNTVFLPPAAARNTISDNILYLNNGSLFGSPRAHGIAIENGPGHVVLRNQIDSSGRDGITLFGGVTNTLVEGNYVTRSGNNGINIRSGATNNVVRSNQTARNLHRGIVVAGQSNEIRLNLSARNSQFDLQDTNPACDNNVWSGNTGGTATPACTRA